MAEGKDITTLNSDDETNGFHEFIHERQITGYFFNTWNTY